MKHSKNILLLVLVLVLSYFTAAFFGKLYYNFVPFEGGFFSGPRSASEFLAGLSLAYLALVLFFYTGFGDNTRKWWIGILLVPVIFFELFFDLRHIYFPVILGLIAWMVGFGISKLMAKKNQKSNL